MVKTGTPPKKPAAPQRSPEETKFLKDMARMEGRPLTPQEEFVALEQAKALGEV